MKDALRNGAWALAAGFIMTGLLPFIENLFGVLTDLSLLELGDVAHPLLQELVRRAPSTYNHSITVGSIAEAAAESINARGLLVRVGAYFHDIGKMLKPGYFVENQGPDDNRHETLVPAMSTLVIIAHIKDGADLARQHRLPAADHRPDRPAPRHHAGGVLLRPGHGAAAGRSQRRRSRREQLPLPGPQAADQGGGRADAGRRRGERQPHAGRSHARAHREPGPRDWPKTACTAASSTKAG